MIPMPTAMNPSPPSHHDSAGGELVSVDGRALPLLDTSLAVEAHGGLARVVLKQRFVNRYDEPLAVRYQVPLPAEGAVSGFAFELDGRRTVGVVERKAVAKRRYEEAIVAGHSAALLEQQRSTLFSQDVGNIPAGAEIVAELAVDQKLRWLTEGRWEWRFPTVVAPRYLGAEGRVTDAAKVKVAVADKAMAAHANLRLRIEDELSAGGLPTSPSHPLHVSARGATHEVVLREESGARLDRDLVVTWPVAAGQARASLSAARPLAGHARSTSSFGLLTLTPALTPAEGDEHVPRDLIVLLDTSGSMHGEPLAQARRVTLALIDSLDERDSLAMIEFSTRPRRWKRKPVAATKAHKADARRWLSAIEAGGATEMHEGILAALAPLRDEAQRQVVLISDGLIGFEDEIVHAISERLPRGSRVHTVGVGSGVNRSLTAAAARAGRGVEAILGIGEDPELVAQRLVAHTAAPAVVDIELSGSALVAHAPRRLPDLFAGAPALISLELRPEGGEVEVRGRTAHGSWEQRIAVPASQSGSGSAVVVSTFARESVEDLEAARAAKPAHAEQIDRQIEELGLAFQIATRLTSWVAVSDQATVDPSEPTRHEVMPHELPFGMSVERLGLRAAAYGLAMPAMQGMAPGAPPPPAAAPLGGFSGMPAASRGRAMAQRMLSREDAFDGEDFDADDGPTGAHQELYSLHEIVAEEARAEVEAPSDRIVPVKPAPAPAQARPSAAKAAKSEAEQEGILGRIGKKVRRLVRGPEVDDVVLSGRVVLSDEQRITVEIEAWDDIDWRPSDLMLRFADGTTLAVTWVAVRSTRSGAVPSGRRLRITVEWLGDAPASPIEQLALMCGQRKVTVRL